MRRSGHQRPLLFFLPITHYLAQFAFPPSPYTLSAKQLALDTPMRATPLGQGLFVHRLYLDNQYSTNVVGY